MSDSDKNKKQSNACINRMAANSLFYNSYDMSKEALKERRKLFSSYG